jgi:hypothetical protein
MNKDIFLTFFFGGIKQRVYDYILVFVRLFLFYLFFFSSWSCFTFLSCDGHVFLIS